MQMDKGMASLQVKKNSIVSQEERERERESLGLLEKKHNNFLQRKLEKLDLLSQLPLLPHLLLSSFSDDASCPSFLDM